MKKQIVFVLTELYSADGNINVDVLGVYSTKTEAPMRSWQRRSRMCWNHTSKHFAVNMTYQKTIRRSLRLLTRMRIFGRRYR